jgi:PIN domain nuclease of toxin-antitoxin system
VIVADTHTWIWWLSNRSLLSATARQTLASETIAVSPMTFWEVAMHAQRRRIQLDGPTLSWLVEAVERSGTIVLEMSIEVAVLAGTLQSDRVRDPVDRIVVATAMHHRLPLVTKDGDIRAAALVETIW